MDQFTTCHSCHKPSQKHNKIGENMKSMIEVYREIRNIKNEKIIKSIKEILNETTIPEEWKEYSVYKPQDLKGKYWMISGIPRANFCMIIIDNSKTAVLKHHSFTIETPEVYEEYTTERGKALFNRYWQICKHYKLYETKYNLIKYNP